MNFFHFRENYFTFCIEKIRRNARKYRETGDSHEITESPLKYGRLGRYATMRHTHTLNAANNEFQTNRMQKEAIIDPWNAVTVAADIIFFLFACFC